MEVPVEKYIEVPKYKDVRKIINYDRKVQKPMIVEKVNQRTL